MSDILSEILGPNGRGDGEPIEADSPAVTLVVFEIGDRLFAFPGPQVVEILPLPPIYFVPGCPRPWRA